MMGGISHKSEDANLHRLTQRQAAKLMNVSVRSVAMASELIKTGRADLCRKAENGELSILAALKLAKPGKYEAAPDRLKALCNAWRAASSAERASFVEQIKMGGLEDE